MAKRPAEAEMAPAPTAPTMSVHLANALVTAAPMSEAELRCVISHCIALEAMLRVSGPRFAIMRGQVVTMHNDAVRRLRGERAAARRRAIEDDDEPLLEIA